MVYEDKKMVRMVFCEAEQTLFASFSGKRRRLLIQIQVDKLIVIHKIASPEQERA
jgi:hypothetical protein